jgi:hypothetical protein
MMYNHILGESYLKRSVGKSVERTIVVLSFGLWGDGGIGGRLAPF